MYEQAVTKIQFAAPQQVRVITERVSFHLAPHDVLLKTRTSIVSPGTELAQLTGLQSVAFPFDPGNRAVGEILALGAAVKDAAIGDRVFSYTPHWSHAVARRLYVRVPDAVDELYAPLAGLAAVGMTSLRVGEVELGDRVAVLGMGPGRGRRSEPGSSATGAGLRSAPDGGRRTGRRQGSDSGCDWRAGTGRGGGSLGHA